MKKTPHKKESLILGKMLQKLAVRLGATVVLEPVWNIVGQITWKSGKRSYFRYNTVDLNPMGSSEIARDKDYSNFFMQQMGYPIVPGSKAFYSPTWAEAIGSKNRSIKAACAHASTIGYPVIVKPNSGSQGKGVALVHNQRQFLSALLSIFKSDRIALIQKPVRGKDYRFVVLDEDVISVYERIPLNVVGDGRTNILGLLKQKQKEFVATSRDTRIRLDDPRIKIKLQRLGLTFRSVPEKGQQVFLLDNANLSTGGDSVDVTRDAHPEFKKLAVRLTRDMGLRLCGVDIMTSGDITAPPSKYYILEINSAPGLDHYAKIGKAQEKVVEDLYFEVLKHMER